MKILILTMDCNLPSVDSKVHSHHCWQIDQYIGCDVTLSLQGREITIPDGQFFIIPTNIEHHILCPSKCVFNSVKFEPETERFDSINAEIIDLECCLSTLHNIFDPDCDNTEIKEHYLEILLLQLLDKYVPKNKPEHELDHRIDKAIQYIEKNVFTPPTLDELAKHVNMSKSNFVRLFREQTGSSAMKRVRMVKGEEAMKMLTYSDLSISQIGDALGFPTLQSFSRFFNKEYAIYPKEFRSKK